MTPEQYYQQDVASGQCVADPLQALAIKQFQRVYDQWLAHQQASWWQKIIPRQHPPIRGLYLWGGVGIGKTYLMDIFYKSLPTSAKLRTHFHRFMRRVHHELTRLQGQRDPLKQVARDLAKQAKIICFDEFFVADITDAMLLANLLAALFAEGVTLVATSNAAPEQLYRNGLQRDRFLPAIALLQQQLDVVHMASQVDYRLRELTQAGTYFYPLDATAEQALQHSFAYFARGQGTVGSVLQIEGRSILARRSAEDVVWFDFHVLCSVPRSQLDYLEIARDYSTVLLSNLPQIKPTEDDVICYLINLVDIFYDMQVKLIISAAVPVAEIYPHGRFAFEFQRTASRLLEMQSQVYLSKPHGRDILIRPE